MTDKLQFEDLSVGDRFKLINPWHDTEMMKIHSSETYQNVVYVNHWRAGTLDYVFDGTPVTFLRSEYNPK
jgi:hypothetical protein